MVIYLGADHRGFTLKEKVKAFLADKGYAIEDMGAPVENSEDDYPDFAIAVAKRVSADSEGSRGVVICGSGGGVSIAANKIRRVRAGLGFSSDQVFDMRHDENINVLSIASDFTSENDAIKMVDIFLKTPFGAAERHSRRLDKITQVENE